VFAFAFQRGASLTDPVGEMFGRRWRSRRRRERRLWGRAGQRRAAVATETFAGWDLGAAGCAVPRQGCAAIAAEPLAIEVVGTASGTLHGRISIRRACPGKSNSYRCIRPAQSPGAHVPDVRYDFFDLRQF